VDRVDEMRRAKPVGYDSESIPVVFVLDDRVRFDVVAKEKFFSFVFI